jgi:hypothetical protein
MKLIYFFIDISYDFPFENLGNLFHVMLLEFKIYLLLTLIHGKFIHCFAMWILIENIDGNSNYIDGGKIQNFEPIDEK